ncbi:hypothetical protein HGRIS_011286 [Hohenbuehelia grisea]|uniref:Uncharacterized protein n=1 Tax=Hohenbuehelia grisea TaxID=104357 RepID=A0ABR3JWU1_9AGAR
MAAAPAQDPSSPHAGFTHPPTYIQQPRWQPPPAALPPMPAAIDDGANAIMAMIEHEKEAAVFELRAQHRNLYAAFTEYRVQANAERSKAAATIAYLSQQHRPTEDVDMDTIMSELSEIGLERVGDKQWRLRGEWERVCLEIAGSLPASSSPASSELPTQGECDPRMMITLIERMRQADLTAIDELKKKCTALEAQERALAAAASTHYSELLQANNKIKILQDPSQASGTTVSDSDTSIFVRQTPNHGCLPLATSMELYAAQLDTVLSEDSE